MFHPLSRSQPHALPTARRAALVIAAALVTTACASSGGDDLVGPSDAGADTTTIVATTTIMGDVTRNVAPADVDVSVLMEAGADPHTFEPSARQIAELQQADLVVTNGGGLEEGLRTALDEAAAAGIPVFTATEHVALLPAGADGAAAAEDLDEHGDVAPDPHIWMDPIRMVDVVDALGATLAPTPSVDGADDGAADSYAAQLRELDRRIGRQLDTIPAQRRTLVTNHDAFAYFADRYDLTVVGTVIPGVSTGAEPSARDIERLAQVIVDEDVTTIFTDSTAPRQLAETLAREAGTDVEIVELFTGSLGGDGDAGSYVEMLTTDAERISEALGR